uniref:hypothetical protein n=1 Tax=Enterococcus faecium TaxID=1352 RepID=UPI00226FC5BD
LWLKTLYRKRAVTWPFIFYTIIWTLSEKIKPEINYFSIEKHDELNVGIEKYSWNVIRIKKM